MGNVQRIYFLGEGRYQKSSSRTMANKLKRHISIGGQFEIVDMPGQCGQLSITILMHNSVAHHGAAAGVTACFASRRDPVTPKNV